MRDYDPTTGRYLQADPLGLVDGASVYGYVKQNPIKSIDVRGEETSVWISYPSDSPWDPGHASALTEKIIWDPNGQACECQYLDGEAKPWLPGTGQTYSRNPRTDRAFNDHASSEGWVVNKYTFSTTPEEEQMIEDRIEQYGGGGALGCAIAVSTVLDGIGPFKDLGTTNWPSTLEENLMRLKGSGN
jgi:hypothetical protein